MSSDHAASTDIPTPESSKSDQPMASTSTDEAFIPTPTPAPDELPQLNPDQQQALDGRSSDADKMFASGIGGGMDDDLEIGPQPLLGTIVLTEEPPDPSGLVTVMDSGVEGQVTDENQQWNEDDSHELKRVKVYELIGSRWVDQGTAFCFGDFQDDGALLIARAEADFNHVILSTTIRANDVYQRQQDTLIVWTEPDGVDYALSFQDPEGCSEVWNFIQEVQRHMNTAGLSSSPVQGEGSITAASIMRSGHLPTPALGIIGEIEKAIKTITRTPTLKERVCEYIQNEEYIKNLIDVLTQAEGLESIENLHALCSCMQTILMLNDHTMYEHILDDELFFGVVGMLEYDPEFPTHKANYREFLRTTAHYHQPIPIRDEAIQKKVHHTYRLQFLKDVVLARAIDDSTFNVLNSCIIFNQIDIINHVQNDPGFLREVVGMFMDETLVLSLGLGLSGESAKAKEPPKEKTPTTPGEQKMDVDPPEGAKPNGSSSEPNGTPTPPANPQLIRRREVIYLIQQLCVMGKNVQLPARMALFRTLSDRGIIFAVQWALGQSEDNEEGRAMIAAAGEILIALLDHDLNGVRQHVVKQLGFAEIKKDSSKPGETILMLLCRVLVRSKDLAVQSQTGEALKLLLEIPPPDTEPHAVMGAKMFQRAKDDPSTEKFLDYFYKQCVDILFKPFENISEFSKHSEPTLPLTRERANVFLYLCELLSIFLVQHSFRSYTYLASGTIPIRLPTLFKARDKHLRLAAFRFFRQLPRLPSDKFFSQLTRHDIFAPILDLSIQESRRDNLVNSACQEFFDVIRKGEHKTLRHHIMTMHGDKIKQLTESPLSGPQFKLFIAKWEQDIEPPPKEEEKVDKTAQNGLRRWGQGRLMEIEEEDYFNADDDDDAILPVLTTNAFPKLAGNGGASPGSGPSSPSLGGSNIPNGLKRKRTRPTGIPIRRGSQPPRPVATSTLQGLVDYGDEDDLSGMPSSPGVEETLATTRSLLSTSVPISTPSNPMPTSPSIPSSPRLQHRQISLKPSEDEDEEDALLENLVTKSPPTNPTSPLSPSSLLSTSGEPKSPSLPLELPSIGAKRRREDDDDELLERIASKSKRPAIAAALKDVGVKLESKSTSPSLSPSPVTSPLNTPKAIDQDAPQSGPKKIKLKLMSAMSSVLSSSPSSTGAKDGDTG